MTTNQPVYRIENTTSMRAGKGGKPFSKRDEGRARRDARKAAARRKRSYLA